MLKHKMLNHRFVESFPEILEPGVLYVSLEYGSVAHSCCCGCGEEVVTPLTPTDWRITYDGEAITLNPSVGSWTLACRSHYVIRRGEVVEAQPWTDAEVEAERRRDRREKARHFGRPDPVNLGLEESVHIEAPAASASWWDRLRIWWTGGP